MYKSKLQELCHQRSWNLPEYKTVKDGPDHNPRFTATVTVNDVPFENPTNQCRSSKEAQNLVAQLAFDHFCAPKTILQPPNRPTTLSSSATPPSPATHASGSSSADDGILHPDQNNSGQAARVNEIPFCGYKDDKRPKDILHMYKNRLQHYAQKHNLTLPAYSCEFDGPPHARRFRSKVTIDNRTYETSEFFPTLKEAEHAAAKVAFESLSRDDIQEDEGLYKTLLQELAQKRGLLFPTYCTVRSGQPHMPTFVSNVEIGGDFFQGHEAKTKKQAEMSAAKVAFNALAEQKVVSGCPVKGASEVTSSSLPTVQSVMNNGFANANPVKVQEPDDKKSIINNGLQQKIAYANPLNMDEATDSKECILMEAMETSSSRKSVIPGDLRQIIFPTASLSANKVPVAEDQDAKSVRYSNSLKEVNSNLQDSLSLTSSLSSQLKLPHDLVTEYENQKPAGEAPVSARKIVVFSRNSAMEIPGGATAILPCSDDKWVAYRVEVNPK